MLLYNTVGVKHRSYAWGAITIGESRTQQEAFSGRLVAASTGFSGFLRVNVVQWCRALYIWVAWFCPHLPINC